MNINLLLLLLSLLLSLLLPLALSFATSLSLIFEHTFRLILICSGRLSSLLLLLLVPMYPPRNLYVSLSFSLSFSLSRSLSSLSYSLHSLSPLSLIHFTLSLSLSSCDSLIILTSLTLSFSRFLPLSLSLSLTHSLSLSLSQHTFGDVQGVGYTRAGIGGFLIILGSRAACGCTSGHGISGFSLLMFVSIVSTMAMFGGGIVAAFALDALGLLAFH